MQMLNRSRKSRLKRKTKTNENDCAGLWHFFSFLFSLLLPLLTVVVTFSLCFIGEVCRCRQTRECGEGKGESSFLTDQQTRQLRHLRPQGIEYFWTGIALLYWKTRRVHCSSKWMNKQQSAQGRRISILWCTPTQNVLDWHGNQTNTWYLFEEQMRVVRACVCVCVLRRTNWTWR